MGYENKKTEQKKGDRVANEDDMQGGKNKAGMEDTPMNAKRSSASDSDEQDRRGMNERRGSGKRDMADEGNAAMTGKASRPIDTLEPLEGKTKDSDMDMQDSSMKPEQKRKEMSQDT